MAVTAKKFKNLSSLEKEIRRLKRQTNQMEEQFDENFSHLQENYLPMILNSVLPEKASYKGIPAAVISMVLDNDRLRNTVVKLAEQLIDKASDGFEFIADKLKHKKN